MFGLLFGATVFVARYPNVPYMPHYSDTASTVNHRINIVLLILDFFRINIRFLFKLYIFNKITPQTRFYTNQNLIAFQLPISKSMYRKFLALI